VIHIIGKIPHRVTVACSGGIDSMAIVNFLREGKRKVTIAYFNHDTLHSRQTEEFIKEFCGKNELNLIVGRVKGDREKRSLEEFWRDERYMFLESLGGDFIITAHHLDDVVETWLMSSFHGQPKIIPYKRGKKIFRPFLLTNQRSIAEYAKSRSLEWVEDPSNKSLIYMRNFVRHKMMPDVLKVNPGIRKTIRKKVLDLYRDI
jgi:tRNA(Ile)-lysidine synthetase-like protein